MKMKDMNFSKAVERCVQIRKLYHQLEHKLGECIWRLIILSERMNINISEALEKFLSETEKRLVDASK